MSHPTQVGDGPAKIPNPRKTAGWRELTRNLAGCWDTARGRRVMAECHFRLSDPLMERLDALRRRLGVVAFRDDQEADRGG